MSVVYTILGVLGILAISITAINGGLGQSYAQSDQMIMTGGSSTNATSSPAIYQLAASKS